jgi:WD40 repeat protein
VPEEGKDRHGDPLPPGAIARLGTIRFRHGMSAQSVAYSPDGKTLAAGGFGVVSLWDALAGKEVRRLTTSNGWLYSVAVSPDGRHVVAGSGSTVTLWGRATGKEVRTLSGHTNVIHVVAFSRDGKRLLTSSADRTARLWDAATGEPLRTLGGHGGEVRALAMDREAKRIATGADDKIVRLWDAATGKELRQLRGHDGELYSVAFSLDGKTLASGDGCGTVILWDAATGKERRRINGRQMIRCVAFSSDGKFLAVSDGDGLLRLFDAGGERLLRDIHQPDAAGGIAFSPDGQTLASTGAENGGIYLWNAFTGKELRREEGHRGRVDRVAISPDGKVVASAGREGGVRLWQAATGKELSVLPDEGGNAWRCLAFSSDGRLLASSRYEVIRIWDSDRRKLLRTIRAARVVGALAFSPDGRILAALGEKFLTFWDPHSGKERCQLGGHAGWAATLSFRADGRALASGGSDGKVCLWDSVTGKRLRQFPTGQGAVTSLALSPDGAFLVTGGGRVGGKQANHTVCLWETASGKLARCWKGSNFSPPVIALSADGRSVAVAGDEVLRIIEVATGGERASFTGHVGLMATLALAPDGRTAVTGSGDSTLLVWDLTGRPKAGERQPAPRGAKELNDLWADLAGADAVKAYRAVWQLAAAPRQAVPYLKERLRPIPRADAARIARLMAALDSDELAVREKASAALKELDELAAPALRRALAGRPSPEVRQRAERLLARLEPHPPGLAERWRFGRALEALEQMSGPEAQALLKSLASGAPEARHTVEAKASLERLTRRRAGH